MADRAPPPPPGFVEDDAAPHREARPNIDPSIATLLANPTGQVHDGDTFRLNTGPNARLFGVDAFELNQTGRSPSGAVVPLGQDARTALLPYATPSGTVRFTGPSTYGRPVATLDNGGDAGQAMLDQGLALATPEYLRGDPDRFHQYMEAERLARLNRRGAFANTFQSPSSFRHGTPDPWAKPEWLDHPEPGSQAVFWDEPTPFQGLRPDIEKGYIGIWQDMRSTPADLIAYARQHGFSIDPEQTRKRYEQRNSSRTASGQVTYADPPHLLTDPGDGITGATLRGLADPINMLDEMGGVVDSLGGTKGRENIWNSERRFGDVLWNNIDQNRSILGHDEAEHPWARFGGQMAGGLVLPGASIEGVGLRAATQVLRAGGTRMAAEAAAKAAVRNRLITAGAIEGGLAGAGGADDGGWKGRLKSGAIGTVVGGTLGGATAIGGQVVMDTVVPRIAARFSRGGADAVEPNAGFAGSESLPSPPHGFEIDPHADDVVPHGNLGGVGDTPPPPPGYHMDGPAAAMSAEVDRPTLVGAEDVGGAGVTTGSPPRPLTPGELMARDNVPDPAALLPGQDAPAARAGNINLANLDSPENIDRALNAASDATGAFADSRRGAISHVETERLAADMGMTADDLLRRRKGQALNAEQALAARQILAKSGNELVTLAQRVQSVENPGDELLAQFRQAWVRHAAIQEQVSGATAEAGRALSQFRMMADSRLARGPVLSGLVHEGGGADRLKDAARLITDGADDPSALNDITRRAMKPRFSDKLVELYYNSLLSGPQTHAVNVMGNTLTSLAQLPEHAVAAGVGAIRRVLPNQRDTDAVMFSELGARAAGLIQGVKEGLPQAWRTFRTGQSSDFVSKVESHYPHAISGVKGSIIRTPTRALAAEDDLFKSMARRMEIGGLAVRQAAKEGLTGDAAKTRAAELVANPTDDMLQRSFDYGQYLTFQSDLGPVGKGVQGITQAMPMLKLVLPFVKTPTNLLKFTIERSPAAPLLKEWRADMAAGGARRDIAAARAMVGSGMMALVTQMVAQGHITGGGPADEDAKALMRANGWQPYSVKIGDKYYSYQRMDPFSSTIGIAADLVDLQGHMTDKQRDETATLLVAATLKNLSNKTWLSGLTDLTDAINDPDRSAKRYLARMAGSLAVPAGVAQVARVNDPVLREAETAMDRIRSRVPGLSQSLEPRRDIWGQPITSEGGLGPDIISPVWQSTDKHDPVTEALLQSGAHFGAPSKTVGGRQLTPQEYGRYQEEIGRRARPVLGTMMGVNDRIAAALFESMPVDERRDMVADALSDVRRDVRKDMFGGGKPPSAREQILRHLSQPPPPSGFVVDH